MTKFNFEFREFDIHIAETTPHQGRGGLAPGGFSGHHPALRDQRAVIRWW